MVRFLLSLAAVCVTAALVHAQDEGPEPTKLFPAPLPSPALKYQLLADLRTQTAGDALPLYTDAVGKLAPLLREAWQQPGGFPFQKWSITPLSELPRDDVRKAFEPYQDILDLVDKAARRERCNGEAPPGTSLSKAPVTLPPTHFLMEIGNLVAVRARLQIADGDFNGAIHTLQTGFSLVRQIGELPRAGYVHTARDIAQVMLIQVETFIEQPKAPNLYWALGDLPQPLFDPRPAVQGERLAVYRSFPGIAEAAADPHAGPLTEEQVQGCVEVLMRYVREPSLIEFRQRALLTKRITDQYEESKKVLLDQGRPKAKVDAMPHVQVVLLAQLTEYDRMMDEQTKWFNEPFDKVADRLNALSKSIDERPRGKIFYPIAAFDAVSFARNRAQLERKINSLRCLEAMRAYAAGHGGKLPAALAEIKDIALPLDPVTGKAFVYKAAGDRATLEAPEVGRESRRYFDEVAYEIVIKRS